MSEEQPYLMEEVCTPVQQYNPNYGDKRICKCGHSYYRHFDSYDQMKAVGCKYCDCFGFEELSPANAPPLTECMDIELLESLIYPIRVEGAYEMWFERISKTCRHCFGRPVSDERWKSIFWSVITSAKDIVGLTDPATGTNLTYYENLRRTCILLSHFMAGLPPIDPPPFDENS